MKQAFRLQGKSNQSPGKLKTSRRLFHDGVATDVGTGSEVGGEERLMGIMLGHHINTYA